MTETKKEFKFYLYNKPALVIVDWYNIWNRYKNIDLKLLFDYLKEYSEISQIRFYHGTIEGKDWSSKIIDDAKSIGYDVVTKESKYTKIDLSKETHLKTTVSLLNDLLVNISEKNSDMANKAYTIRQKVEGRLSRNEIDTEHGSIVNFLDNDEDLYAEIFDFVESLDPNLAELNKKINEFKNEIKKPIKKLKCDFDAEIARDMVLNISNFDNLILFSGDGDFASTVEYLIREKLKRVFVIYPQGNFGEIDYKNFGLIKFDEKGRRVFKDNFISRPVDHIVERIIKKEPADCSAGPDVDNITNQDLEVK